MELGGKRHRHCAMDIKRKKYIEPVWRLLGGAHNPVQSYVTFGLKQYSTGQLIEVAKQVVAQGEKRRLKMVVARKHPAWIGPALGRA